MRAAWGDDAGDQLECDRTVECERSQAWPAGPKPPRSARGSDGAAARRGSGGPEVRRPKGGAEEQEANFKPVETSFSGTEYRRSLLSPREDGAEARPGGVPGLVSVPRFPASAKKSGRSERRPVATKHLGLSGRLAPASLASRVICRTRMGSFPGREEGLACKRRSGERSATRQSRWVDRPRR